MAYNGAIQRQNTGAHHAPVASGPGPGGALGPCGAMHARKPYALRSIATNEPRHEKNGFSLMSKQRRRSALQ